MDFQLVSQLLQTLLSEQFPLVSSVSHPLLALNQTEIKRKTGENKRNLNFKMRPSPSSSLYSFCLAVTLLPSATSSSTIVPEWGEGTSTAVWKLWILNGENWQNRMIKIRFEIIFKWIIHPWCFNFTFHGHYVHISHTWLSIELQLKSNTYIYFATFAAQNFFQPDKFYHH